MPRTRSPRRPTIPLLVPRVKVWLEQDGAYAFGLGIAEILRAVGRTGSIKQAAADLGKSYRYVWGRIKEAEEAFGRPLVEARVGGRGSRRSSLTPVDRRMVTGFLTLRARVLRFLEDEFARQFGPGSA